MWRAAGIDGGSAVSLSSLGGGWRHEPHLPAPSGRVEKGPITHREVLHRRLLPHSTLIMLALHSRCQNAPFSERSCCHSLGGKRTYFLRAASRATTPSTSIEFSADIEMIEIQQRVEHQEITADRFAAINGIVREQHHMALPQWRIDYDGALRDVVAIQQS